MKLVNMTPEGDLLLKFKVETSEERDRIRAAVADLPGALWKPARNGWLVWHTRRAERYLLEDTPAWRFIGDAYCEILKPRQIPKIALPAAETIDLTPYGITPKAREFQLTAVQGIKARGDRCLVSYPPGAGKTLIAASWLKTLKLNKPMLIVCPAFMKEHWRRELKMWAGEDAVIVGGRQPSRLPDQHLIINYEVLKAWAPTLQGNFDGIIGDETHYLATDDSDRTIAFDTVRKRMKYMVMLTGTPIRSRLSQLWPTASMLAPKVFDSKMWFLNRYCEPKRDMRGQMVYKGATHVEELRELLFPYMIRETKKSLMPWLPKKNRTMVHVPVSKDIVAKSRELRDLMNQAYEDGGIKAAETISKLQSLSCSAYFEKRKHLHDWIDDQLDEGVEKLIVVAVHHVVIDDLKKKYKDFLVIDGRVPAKLRQGIVDQFQTNPDVVGIIIQATAGGVGITLDSSKDMVFAEIVWTPGELEQLEDRQHRIATVAPNGVNYHYFVADGTVEEEMVSLVDAKNRVSSSVLDANAQDFFQDVNHIYLSK